MFDEYTKTFDEFSQYDNLFAVDIGSEIIQDGTPFSLIYCVKINTYSSIYRNQRRSSTIHQSRHKGRQSVPGRSKDAQNTGRVLFCRRKLVPF